MICNYTASKTVLFKHSTYDVATVYAMSAMYEPYVWGLSTRVLACNCDSILASTTLFLRIVEPRGFRIFGKGRTYVLL